MLLGVLKLTKMVQENAKLTDCQQRALEAQEVQYLGSDRAFLGMLQEFRHRQVRQHSPPLVPSN